MEDLTIRGLDEALVSRLEERARQHGRTAEDEVREMIELMLEAAEPRRQDEDIGSFARRIIAPFGGVNLEAFERGHRRVIPDFTAPEFDPSP